MQCGAKSEKRLTEVDASLQAGWSCAGHGASFGGMSVTRCPANDVVDSARSPHSRGLALLAENRETHVPLLISVGGTTRKSKIESRWLSAPLYVNQLIRLAMQVDAHEMKFLKDVNENLSGDAAIRICTMMSQRSYVYDER